VLLAVGLGVAAGVTRYATVPVDRLRDTLVYRPAGAPTTREAGLGVAGNVALDQVPEILLLALLFNEDKKFFEHHGFDFEEIGNSVREWIGGRRLRGASTVTQQLARTIFQGPGRTIRRKLVEAIDTVRLEHTLTKDEVLVLYLNTVPWGPGVYGIAAAAAHYFKRPPAELEPMACVFLAAILPSPGRLAAGFETWRLPPATAARMRRLLGGVRGVLGGRVIGGGGGANEAGAGLLAAVRGARERARDQRAAR
jgi:monofunctional biosynthetic peptidoglycan transglycosylase